ncbi:MAG: TIM barrel protein [Phycisphaerae bacterium]|jgi:hydroxypyruvate isomerase
MADIQNCGEVRTPGGTLCRENGRELEHGTSELQGGPPGYQNDHTACGVAVCERVNSPRVKLLYDIYHMQIMEGDVIRTLRDNIQWIGHFHTAGNPGRGDLDDTQELNSTGICKAISATGYDLYVGHEFKPKGDPIEAMKSAFVTCNVA